MDAEGGHEMTTSTGRIKISQLVEQLKFPLPDGTHPGVQVPRARCPLALALHV
jgi:hypothetical protein